MSKNKKTNASQIKRARLSVLGIILEWTDFEPLTKLPEIESIVKTKVYHDNPMRRLVCIDVWKKYNKWIIESVFTWEIDVFIVFKSNRGDADKVDHGSFRLTCAIRDKNDNRLEDAIEKFITESKLANYLVGENLGKDHKSYGEYIRTDFKCKIVGV